MWIDNTYKAKSTAYPSHDVDPASKGAEWHMQFAKALYSNYLNDRCGIRYSEVAQMIINRSYAAGNQDTEQYKDILIGKKDIMDGQRKGWANIDFSRIVSVAPKFRRILLGIFLGQEHEISCNAIDENAGSEREDMMWRVWAEKKEKQLIALIDGITGTETPESEYEPATIEELELYNDMGGFKLKLEVAMENALGFIDYDSNWRVIKGKLIGDAVDLGKMAVKDYVDVATQKVKKRYVDPIDFIYTLDQDGQISKAAEFRLYTIETIREETGLPEATILKMAEDVRGRFGNASNIDGFRDFDEKTGAYKYNDFVVPVLETEFASNDIKYKTERKTRSGDTVMFDEPWRTTSAGKRIPPKVWNTDNKKTKSIPVKVYRKCKWAIGTETCWDYGLSFDIPRPKRDQALSSYHVVTLDGIPIMQAAIPNFDQVQLANLRIQNALAMAPNSGIAYEFSSLQGMSIGAKGLDPMDIVKMHRQSGSFFYKATVHRGGMISPTAGKPIQELSGGIGPILNECMAIISMNLETIRDVTGIGQGMDAMTPGSETGLGVMQQTISATNNSLRPIYDAYITLKEDCARSCVLRVQTVAKYSKGYWGYDKVVGKVAWSAIEMSADFTFSEMGIKISALPTAQDVMDMEATLRGALQSGQNGKPTITMSEYFAIKRIIRSGGSLKFAQVLLAHREAKNKEAELKLQQENMQINQKGVQDLEAQKAQQDQQALILAANIEKDKFTHETNENIRLEEAKSGFKKSEISLNNQTKPEKVSTE